MMQLQRSSHLLHYHHTKRGHAPKGTRLSDTALRHVEHKALEDSPPPNTPRLSTRLSQKWSTILYINQPSARRTDGSKPAVQFAFEILALNVSAIRAS